MSPTFPPLVEDPSARLWIELIVLLFITGSNSSNYNIPWKGPLTIIFSMKKICIEGRTGGWGS